MTDYRLAMEANKILKDNKTQDRSYHVCDLAPWGIGTPVFGTLIYVGCGSELSPLFLFEEADCYIHQDLGDIQLFHAFQILEQHGIITDFQITSEKTSERRYEFRYKKMPKTVVEVFNSRENLDKHIHDGDVALNVHPLAQEGLDAIYFWAFPYEDAIKAIQINLLPHLKIDGVFEGSYYSNYFYGARPNRLGLENGTGTYIKTRHLTSDEIEEAVEFTIDDYIEKELVSPWVWPEDKPKIRKKASKRGVHFRGRVTLFNKFTR